MDSGVVVFKSWGTAEVAIFRQVNAKLQIAQNFYFALKFFQSGGLLIPDFVRLKKNFWHAKM